MPLLKNLYIYDNGPDIRLVPSIMQACMAIRMPLELMMS